MTASKPKFRSGFTLIELLVVISIVSLMASIIMAALSTARMKSRDARRMMDLHQIQIALTLYYNDYGGYPSTGGAWLISCDQNPTSDTNSWLNLQTLLAPYMKTVPIDPVNTPTGSNCLNGPWSYNVLSYGYSSRGKDKYDLVAQLEDTGSAYKCGLKKYLYHDLGSEGIWCSGGYNYSDQLYADH